MGGGDNKAEPDAGDAEKANPDDMWNMEYSK